MNHRIFWKGGSRVPPAKVNHNEIRYFRDGIFTTEDKDVMGTYTRILDNSGIKGNQNEAIITTSSDAVVTLHDPEARFVHT